MSSTPHGHRMEINWRSAFWGEEISASGRRGIHILDLRTNQTSMLRDIGTQEIYALDLQLP